VTNRSSCQLWNPSQVREWFNNQTMTTMMSEFDPTVSEMSFL
jgi:hypothetical protein